MSIKIVKNKISSGNLKTKLRGLISKFAKKLGKRWECVVLNKNDFDADYSLIILINLYKQF